jgi:Bacterial regulatory proteins, luxR family
VNGLVIPGMFRFTTGKVRGHHRIPVICRRSTVDRAEPHPALMAGELSISLNTVSTHIRQIYAKLGATDRSSAARRGRDLRLLSSGRA